MEKQMKINGQNNLYNIYLQYTYKKENTQIQDIDYN